MMQTAKQGDNNRIAAVGWIDIKRIIAILLW
jgi:hypothetical protein